MIVLFNPLSTTPGKQPLPLSVLSLAAVLDDRVDWRLVDGNIERDPASAILAAVDDGGDPELKMLAVTVMPGPQLPQAVAVCRQVRAVRPGLPIVWGGYFPTQHADTVLGSPFVDFVVRSQGERAIVGLIDTLARGGALSEVANLSWKRGGKIIHNPLAGLVPLDDLPNVPYARVPMARYLHRNYLGRRTVAYNSSFGCPFACGFCAVGAMAHRRWLAQSPERISKTLDFLHSRYGVDAVQMHDMDFFISEARTAEFANRVARLGIRWWGLGRTDTLMAYSDDTWRAMARSGLKMIFSGAESGSAEQLAAMTKGGRSSPSITLELARRMRDYDIVPEFSFVLGCPPDPLADIELTFEFIRRLKVVNPSTEIVLYTYTPVPMDGALYDAARQTQFVFPDTLDEWATPRWERLSMRRGDGIPWMKATVRRRVRNFERVINAFYPTVTDPGLAGWHRAVLKAASSWRYALKWYGVPYELQALHRLIRYQRPETTGF